MKTFYRMVCLLVLAFCLSACGKYSGLGILAKDSEKAMDALLEKHLLGDDVVSAEIEKHFTAFCDGKETLGDFPYLVKLMKLSPSVTTKTFKAFLADGATLTDADDDGMTPMEYACRAQQDAWVNFLLAHSREAGMGNSLITGTVCSDQSSLVTLAVQLNDGDLLKMLLREQPSEASRADKAGRLPLLLALQAEHTYIAEMLLKAGANPATPNREGVTPFGYAFKKGDDELCMLLVSHLSAANIPAVDGKPALQAAFESGRMVLFEKLMQAGCSVPVQDDNRCDLLMAACRQGNVKAVELVLQQCTADFLANGKTPLMEACVQGHLDVVNRLLAQGVQVNNASAEGDTALLLAVRHNRENLVQPLLQAHANPNIGDASGKTALMVAAEAGHADMVRALLQGGADVLVKDKEGRLPMDVAAGDEIRTMIAETLGKRLVAEANTESSSSLYNAAVCYADGIGVPKSSAKAAELLTLLSKRNYAPALNLSALISYQSAPEKNAESAVKLWTKAAENGSLQAVQNLAFCRMQGIGCAQDAQAALNGFAKAAAGGVTEAMANAGVANEQLYGGSATYKNYAAAAARGNVSAMANAGRCELLGLYGAKKEEEKGFQYLVQAAEKGNAMARYNMALCYIEGMGTDVNSAKGYRILEEMADSFAPAAYNAGLLSELGKGTSQSYTKAARFYEKAVASELPEAMYNLGRLHEKGQGVSRDEARAFELYSQAAEQGLGLAHFALGICYQKGIGTEKNLPSAIDCLRKAAANEDAAPLYFLGMSYLAGGAQEDTAEEDETLASMSTPEKAVYYFRKAAEKKYAPAQYELAECLMSGKGCKKSAEEAFLAYKQAAEQGEPRAVYALARCYHLGLGTARDNKKAAAGYLKAARLGNAVAMYNAGALLQRGADGLPKDAQGALKWYTSAAEQGYTPAFYALGDCYNLGIGTEVNRVKAAEYYQKGSAAGDVRAKHNLAVCLAKGEGAVQDVAAAYKLFDEAAQKNYAPAQYNAALCLLQGIGVQKDEAAAVALLRKAAKSEPAARYNLACCLLQGVGTARREKEAAAQFLKLAESGHQLAAYRLGMCYASGTGVAKNVDEAHRWLESAAKAGIPEAVLNKGVLLAAEKGNEPAAADCFQAAAEKGMPEAEYQYALCLLHGKGRPRDVQAGLKLLQSAADQGLASAVYTLGIVYDGGITGVAPQPELAARNYRRAVELLQPLAEQGDAAAQTRLGCCYYLGLGVIINYQTAVDWFSKAAEQENAEAMYYLGLCYLSGKGVPKDSAPAKQWFRKAADHGHAAALKLLNH